MVWASQYLMFGVSCYHSKARGLEISPTSLSPSGILTHQNHSSNTFPKSISSTVHRRRQFSCWCQHQNQWYSFPSSQLLKSLKNFFLLCSSRWRRTGKLRLTELGDDILIFRGIIFQDTRAWDSDWQRVSCLQGLKLSAVNDWWFICHTTCMHNTVGPPCSYLYG